MGNFIIRREEGFIALTPVVLSFQPQISLVMIMMTTFHARVELPENDRELRDVIDAMLNPVKRHSVSQIAFLTFDDKHKVDLLDRLIPTFLNEGVDV